MAYLCPERRGECPMEAYCIPGADDSSLEARRQGGKDIEGVSAKNIRSVREREEARAYVRLFKHQDSIKHVHIW